MNLEGSGNFVKRKKLFRLLGVCAGGALILWLGLWLWLCSADREPFAMPDYEKTDLEPLLARASDPAEPLSAEEYHLLFLQTGLGPAAIEDLRRQADFPARLRSFQENFFQPRQAYCRRVFFPVWQEWLQTPEGEWLRFELAPVKEGDVLLTRSTHCLGWRMGHAGLVADTGEARALESFGLGLPVDYASLSHWEEYPTFILLRLKDAGRAERAGIAAYARENFVGVPYQLTAGFWDAKKLAPALSSPKEESQAARPALPAFGVLAAPEALPSAVTLPGGGALPDAEEAVPTGSGIVALAEEAASAALRGTQCAHLIWAAFAAYGYDADSDGGWLVTPRDLALSPLFEVVQIYGVDPAAIWP